MPGIAAFVLRLRPTPCCAASLKPLAAWYRKRAAKQCGTANSECGGLTVIQRASSDLRRNPHFHTLFLDGVYVRDDADANASPVFHPAPPPTQDDVQAVAWEHHRSSPGAVASAIKQKGSEKQCHCSREDPPGHCAQVFAQSG